MPPFLAQEGGFYLRREAVEDWQLPIGAVFLECAGAENDLNRSLPSRTAIRFLMNQDDKAS